MRLWKQIVALVSDEFPLDEFRRLRVLLPIHALDVGRTAAAYLIHDVDGIAVREKILRPAVSSVDRAGKSCARGAAALDHDDRERMRAILRDLILDIGLAREHLALRRIDVF